MRKLVLSFVAAGAFISSGYAQTLFTYGPNSVSKDEFLRVYKKNSINKKAVHYFFWWDAPQRYG
jgi:hypothetical protein